MKYLKINRYIINTEGIHGVICIDYESPCIIITYNNGMGANLEFKSSEAALDALDKIALTLGAD